MKKDLGLFTSILLGCLIVVPVSASDKESKLKEKSKEVAASKEANELEVSSQLPKTTETMTKKEEAKNEGAKKDPKLVAFKPDEKTVMRTYKIKEMDRFKPLPPRSTKKAIDPNSAEGKKIIENRKLKRRVKENTLFENAISSKEETSKFIALLKRRYSHDKKMIKKVSKLEKKILPSEKTMKRYLTEKNIFLKKDEKMGLVNPVELDRVYRIEKKMEFVVTLRTFFDENQIAF